jgi:TolB-like protein
MDMLVYLAGRAGETVSRETLVNEIWASSYGSDEALSRIISLLRSQLGDSSKKPRYIATIPKTGYRLLVHPQPVSSSVPVAGKIPNQLAGAIVVLLLVASSLAAYFIRRDPPAGPEDPVSYTVAVLPFQAFGGDEGELLSVGLTNEIINNLNRSQLLRIVARNSLDTPQNNGGGSRIDYFLEGSVDVADERVRVHAEITDAREGLIVWSDTFDSPGTDYFEVQQELSDLIFNAINGELGIAVEPPQQEEVDMIAFEAYLNGVFLSKLRGEEPLRASIDSFQSALARESAFDSARVALAHAEVLLPYYSGRSEQDAFAAASEQLDMLQVQTHGEAEAIRGFIAFREWRWLEAERHFRLSLELNPNVANTHVWYSQFLSTVGRLEDSLVHAQAAYELDSVSPVVNGRLATAYLWLDRDAEAQRLFSVAENLGFSSFQNRGVLISLLRMGDYDTIRQGLRSLHPDADLEPLLVNLENLLVPEARSELVQIVDQLVSEDVLIPRLEFGVWIVLEQWQRVLETLLKYESDKKYLDVEILFAREAQQLRVMPIFDQLAGFLGLDNYWQSTHPPDFK